MRAHYSIPSKHALIVAAALSLGISIEARAESLGLEGLNRLFLLTGRTSTTSSTLKIDESDIEPTNSNLTHAWGAGYYFRLGDSLWIGPEFSYSNTRTESDSDGDTSDVSTSVLSPGVGLRFTINSGEDQYIALSGGLSYDLLTSSEDYDTSGNASSYEADGSGMSYGGGIAFGQRLGTDNVYLIEFGVGYRTGSIDASVTGDLEFDYTQTAGGLSLGISIGRAF